jgi:peptidoglycan/LPS O-acetylase OafA/YrhL
MVGTENEQKLGRIEAFDSLRGLAALGVVLWHYGVHFDAHPLGRIFSPFYHAGYLFVDFFFVLSGYVIARAYWTVQRERRLADNIRSRLARLYPLHFFTLVIVAGLQLMLASHGRAPFIYSANDAYHFFLNLFLLNGTGLQSGFSFNGPSWSISCEFLVNVAFLVFISSAIFWRCLYSIVAVLLALTLFMVSGTLLRNNLILGYVDPQLVRCMLGFSTGVLLQLAQQRGWWLEGVGSRWVREIMAIGAIASTLMFMAYQRPHATIMAYLIFIALSALVLVTVFRSVAVNRVLRSPALVFLGEISYSIYLTHFPLQLSFVILSVYLEMDINYADTSVLTLFFVLLIGLSWITYRYIEKPGQAAMNPRRRSPAPEIATAP